MAWLLAACLLASIAARPARADDGPNWVIGAHHSLFVGDGGVVYGDIAAEADVSAPFCADSSEVTLGIGVVVHGSVWGDAVSVRGTPADAGFVHYATSLTPAASNFPSGATADDLALPIELFEMSVPDYPPETPLAAVTVAAGATVVLEEGVYASLTLEAGIEGTETTVLLSGGDYGFGSITIGSHALLGFTGSAMVFVEGRLSVADHVAIGASWDDGVAAQNTGIVVLGGNGSGAGGLADDPKAATFGYRTTLNTQIWAPNGTLRLGDDAYVRGRIAGRWTELGEDAVVTAPGASCGLGRLPTDGECDDGDPCTEDGCDASGACENVASTQCGPSAFGFSTEASVWFTSLTSSSATVTWDAAWPAEQVSYYELRQDDVLIAYVSAYDRSWPVSGLSLGTNYAFEVTAVSHAGVHTEPLSSTTLNLSDTTPPVWPLPVLDATLTETGFDLDWPPAWDDIGVQRYHVTIDGEPMTGDGIVATQLQVTALTLGQTYTVIVRAEDTAGNVQTEGLTRQVTTLDIVRPHWDPGSLVGALTGNGLELEWDGAVDNVAVTGYYIIVYEDGMPTEDAWVPVPVTFPYVMPAASAAEYGVLLFPCDGSGLDSCGPDPLALALGTLYAETVAPTWPNPNLQVLQLGPTWVELGWNAAVDASGVARYEVRDAQELVHASTNRGQNLQVLAVYGLQPDTSYTFHMQAFDWWGNGSSNGYPITFTTQPPLADWLVAPSLVATPLSDTEVYLEWSGGWSAFGPVDYEVTVSPTPPEAAGGFWGFFSGEHPYGVVSGLTPGSSYNVSVVLRDPQGQPCGVPISGQVSMPSSRLGASWQWPASAWLTAERVGETAEVSVAWAQISMPAHYQVRLTVRRADAAYDAVMISVYPPGITSTSVTLPTGYAAGPFRFELQPYDPSAWNAPSVGKLTASIDRLWPDSLQHRGRFQAVARDAARQWEAHVGGLGSEEAIAAAYARCQAMGQRGGVPSFTTNARGFYSAISGCELSLSTQAAANSSAEDVARAFLAENSALFGISADDLATRVTYPMIKTRPQRDGSERVMLRQTIDGLAVFTSRITLAVRGGRILKVTANLTPPDALAPLSSGIDQEDAEDIAAAATSADPAAGFTVQDGIYDPASRGRSSGDAVRVWRIRVHGRLAQPDVYVDRATGAVLAINERSSGLGWKDLDPQARQVEGYSQRVSARKILAADPPSAPMCDPESSEFESAVSLELLLEAPFVRAGMLQYTSVIETETGAPNYCKYDPFGLGGYPYTYCATETGALATSCNPSEATTCRASSCSDTGAVLAATLEQVGAFYYEWGGRVGWDDDPTSEDHRIRVLTDFGPDRSPCCGPLDNFGVCSEEDLPGSQCSDTLLEECCARDPAVECDLPQVFADSGGNTSPGRWLDQGRIVVVSSNLRYGPKVQLEPVNPQDPPAFARGPLINNDDGFKFTVAHELCHGIEYSEAQVYSAGLDPPQDWSELSTNWVHEAVADVMGVLRQAHETEPVCGSAPEWYLGLKCGGLNGTSQACPCGAEFLDAFGYRTPSFQVADPLGGEDVDPLDPDYQDALYIPLHLSEIARAGGSADNSRVLTKIAQLIGDPPPSGPLAQTHHGMEVANIAMLPWSYKDLTRLFLDTLLVGPNDSLAQFRDNLIRTAASLTTIDAENPPDCSSVCSRDSTCGAGPACEGAPTCIIAPTCETDPACASDDACGTNGSPAPEDDDCPTAEAIAASAEIIAMVRSATDAVGLWTDERPVGETDAKLLVPWATDVVTTRLGTRRYLFWIGQDGALAYRTRECSFDAETGPDCEPAEDHVMAYDVSSFAVAAREATGSEPGQLFVVFAPHAEAETDAELVLCWIDENETIAEGPYPSVAFGIHVTADDGLALAVQTGFLYLFYRDNQSSPAGRLRVAALDLAHGPWSTNPTPWPAWEVVANTPLLYPQTAISAVCVPADIAEQQFAGRVTVAFGADAGPPANTTNALTIWNFDPATPSSADLSHWRSRNADSTECMTPQLLGRPLIAWFRGYLHFAVNTDIGQTPDQGASSSALLSDPGIVYARSHPSEHTLTCTEAGASFPAWTTAWRLETAKEDRALMLDVEPAGPGFTTARLMLWSIPPEPIENGVSTDPDGTAELALRSKASD